MMNNFKAGADPITLEILRYRINSIPNQIEKNVARTAYTALVSEYKDYSVGIVDCEGKLITQCRGGLPIFVANALGTAVKDGLEVYGADRLKTGDLVLCNWGGCMGQHLNNIVLYTPIRYGEEDELFGFFAILVHHKDVGGAVVGSCSSFNTIDVWAEGIQFRSVKLISEGKPVEEIYRMVEYNTRFPKEVLGDLSAQVSGCIAGRDKVLELMEQYGLDTVKEAVWDIWTKSEQAMRSAIREIPDGTYTSSLWLDDDGINRDKHIACDVIVKIEGDEITIDYTNSGEQNKGAYNSGFNGGAVCASRMAAKYLFTGKDPANDGDFAPLTVVCPEGKWLNCKYGAPISRSGINLPTVIDGIFQALADVAPERVRAGHFGTYLTSTIDGINPETNTRFHYLTTSMGGYGAGKYTDGTGPYRSLAHGDCPELAIEMQEHMYPMQLVNLSLRTDSGGAGEHRGGLGIEKAYRALCDFVITLNFDRKTCPPQGLFGGHNGDVAYADVERDGKIIGRYYKEKDLPLKKGDIIRLGSGGGGGFGNPINRDPELVAYDVQEGYVSVEAARRDYGVVLDAAGRVDVPQTEALRATMR